jgi:hypothetical protein
MSGLIFHFAARLPAVRKKALVITKMRSTGRNTRMKLLLLSIMVGEKFPLSV